MGSVFLSANDANTVLRRNPRANYAFEEIKQGNIERECMEELCTYEEAREAFENNEKTKEFWKDYEKGLKGNSSETDGHFYTMYLLAPLLTSFVLIILILFLIWRCHFQKGTLRRAAYSSQVQRVGSNQNTSVVIDHSQSNVRQSGVAFSRNDLCGSAGLVVSLPLNVRGHSDSESTRLSNGDPPPSYEEATGHSVACRSGTMDPQQHTDLPPQYEEIMISPLQNSEGSAAASHTVAGVKLS
ncbi:transmembrane gamma-carboxyglutamic acid protein 1 [Protopterus annectens]|uniref:transmembrane gamma-carboxyglutamic acid protein 1 n=1 Tax=Protopterus annectens TaxID=7888 RepID=UPI001CF9BA72|nr:transmembrane gamma-carboxyglutamic acid protein 1 [Protopterus annectens]